MTQANVGSKSYASELFNLDSALKSGFTVGVAAQNCDCDCDCDCDQGCC